VTDLRDQLARLVDDEPEAPYDIDAVLRSGRRARRRHHAALAAAGTVGAAGLTAAVVIPVLATGGSEASLTVGGQPSHSPSPAATHGKCYVMAAPPSAVKREIARLARTEKLGKHPTVTTVKPRKLGDRRLVEVCTQGMSPVDPRPGKRAEADQPAGPPYSYSEEPTAIASRLGAHLHDRVSGFGLSITYTRPFSQESSTLERGHPSYFGGNVDVLETSGYGDIGVQVTHSTTEQVPFTGDCAAADNCEESTLPDGSVLRTAEVKAGPGLTVITAEVHRTDGVVVQAQMSNYPFGPDAGTQKHGDQPLTLKQLISLAQDSDFTF